MKGLGSLQSEQWRSERGHRDGKVFRDWREFQMWGNIWSNTSGQTASLESRVTWIGDFSGRESEEESELKHHLSMLFQICCLTRRVTLALCGLWCKPAAAVPCLHNGMFSISLLRICFGNEATCRQAALNTPL